jgi:thioesterase domain-containing protein/acyl carrier protein
MNTSHLKEKWTEAALRQLLIDELARMLKVDVAELNSTSSFDEYGLDSIDAVIATGWLGEQLGVELPPEFLFRHTSVNKVVQALLNGDYAEAPTETKVNERTLIFLFPGAGGRDEQNLIRFRANSPQSIRFEVVRIGNWQEWIERDFDFETIISHVCKYMEEIAGADAFSLAGYSQGGQLAYATAIAMERAGRPVKFLGLLDSAAQGPEPEVSTSGILKSTADSLRIGKAIFAAKMRKSKSSPGASRIRIVGWLWPFRREISERRKLYRRVKRLSQIFCFGPGGVRLSVFIQMRLFWELWLTWLKQNGTSKLAHTPAFLFRAEDAEASDLGWTSSCLHLTVVPVTGNHYTMFDEQHLKSLINQFVIAVDRAARFDRVVEKALS